MDAEPAYGAPVTDLTDLDGLDSAEMVEGYLDGFNGEPEPLGNRSRAYWHGWRNGAVDGKHREADAAQAILAEKYVAHPHPSPKVPQ
jgi:hypothetical protein